MVALLRDASNVTECVCVHTTPLDFIALHCTTLSCMALHHCEVGDTLRICVTAFDTMLARSPRMCTGLSIKWYDCCVTDVTAVHAAWNAAIMHAPSHSHRHRDMHKHTYPSHVNTHHTYGVKCRLAPRVPDAKNRDRPKFGLCLTQSGEVPTCATLRYQMKQIATFG